ncbi:hypothetical protein NQ317_003933 [Molorchus minor]|uniref:DUF4806 domain-containing protein n=1 Tax=Molorchus minor TaxID=1323400 RepID=A0ABQ9IS17_9CUCU|nr:hypothetical protein NQ317_003933 [Molorchus minor]
MIVNEPLQNSCAQKLASLGPTQYCNFRNDAFSTSITTLHSNSPTTSRTSTLDQLTVTDKLVALVSHIKQQNDHILEWTNKQNSSVNTTKFGMPFSFPVETVDELDQLNSYISDNSDQFTALALYLSTLGGDTVTSKTNRILKHIMSDVIASKFNYYGQRSQKRPFSDLPLKNLIVGAVKKGISKSTDKEVEDVVKVWLKHAQERLKKKHARKDQI